MEHHIDCSRPWRRVLRSARGAALVSAASLAMTGNLAAAQEALQFPLQVVIQPDVFYMDGNNCGGSTLTVQIEAEANPTGGIQVGFFESSAGAIGDQMNASGWLAALVSAELSQSDLRDYRVSYNWTGLIDGPSAGGLMTSGILALLRGDAVPSDVTMTGTINPDGTIGPVGGIAHKIEGVAASNIKRFAIPLGKRQDTNNCTGEMEDVVEIGRALGVEVVEVGDIYEAYAFLTGSSLPKPQSRPLSTEFADDLRSGFRALYQVWLTRYRAAGGIVAGAQPQDFPKEFRPFWSDAEKFLASSDRELRSGHEPAAFNRIWMAVLNAEFVARSVGAMQALLNSQGFPGLQGVVEQEIAAAERHVATGLDELRDIQIVSVVDAGAVSNIGN